MGDNDTRLTEDLDDAPTEKTIEWLTRGMSLAGWHPPPPDDCDESEPDARDQEIARLRSIISGWAARWSSLVERHARVNNEAACWMADWKALVLENAALRAQLAAPAKAAAQVAAHPLHRAIGVRR